MPDDTAPGAPARSSLPDRQRSTGPLSGRQHRRKEDLLTQPASARVPESGNALVLKQGSLFLLATDSGDVPWDLPHGFGLFYEDCRFLDGYTLTMNGAELTVLSSAAGRAFETHHDLANPALTAPDGGPPIAKETIAVRRKRLIHGGVLHELLTIRNYGSAAAGLRLELRFRSRFEDVFILRGFVAGPRGTAHLPRVSDGGTLDLGYDGRDGRQRSTSIAFSPARTARGP